MVDNPSKSIEERALYRIIEKKAIQTYIDDPERKIEEKAIKAWCDDPRNKIKEKAINSYVDKHHEIAKEAAVLRYTSMFAVRRLCPNDPERAERENAAKRARVEADVRAALP